MQERDRQVKNMAIGRAPLRKNTVCQYYADPGLKCSKRETCPFDHPSLCRIEGCDARCNKLHIEGLDFGKWRNQPIRNPFKEPKIIEGIRRDIYTGPCRHYMRGFCELGSNCKFEHPEMEEINYQMNNNQGQNQQEINGRGSQQVQ